MSDIGKRIRKLRKQGGYTQKQLVVHLHTTTNHVQKIETAIANPNIDLLTALAVFFNVPVEFLIFGERKKDELDIHFLKHLLNAEEKNIDILKLVNMILFFAAVCHLNKTKLNKLCFYADFSHFKKYSKSITNMSYVRLPHEPAMNYYNAILGILEARHVITVTKVVLNEAKMIIGETIEVKKPFNRNSFYDSEFKTIKQVAFTLGDESGAALTKRAHADPYFAQVETVRKIPYEMAVDISLPDTSKDGTRY
jgi:transcriptional regulator with XRE-family HTH domain